ncbi:MAG: hypothetical protein EXR77_09660 [Myxococcales bacterium]|nr:hypothetical protein [Myxococcales bacterium]
MRLNRKRRNYDQMALFAALGLHLACANSPPPIPHQLATASMAAALQTPDLELNTGQLVRVRKAIDDSAAGRHPALTVALNPVQLRILRRAELPVLLPAEAAVLNAGLATAERDWYSLSSNQDGLTIVVQGDRVATVDPGMIPAGWVAPTWQSPLVTRNEGIAEATFLAFGASYLVAVECAQPDRDIRCTEDDFVVHAIASLRLAQVRP